MIVFSVMAVTTRKILRAATYLLFTLFAAAVVYFMLDYEFLGAVQIAVYAGGLPSFLRANRETIPSASHLSRVSSAP